MTDQTRVIWFYWRQGAGNAPAVVSMCHRSWVRENPGWTVRFVDATTEADWVDMPPWSARLTPQQYADLLRLSLLERHGGVWVDATTYCNTALDHWLPACMPAGFFAFARPNRGQRLDVWFLAAARPDDPVVAATRTFLERYFRTSPSLEIGRGRTLVRKIVYRLLSRTFRTSEWWFSAPVRRGLGLAPYYATAYAFNRTLRLDPRARAVWSQTPQVSADGPHLLWAHGLDKPADDSLLLELSNPTAPLYKLSWKSPALDNPDTALGRFVADRVGLT